MAQVSIDLNVRNQNTATRAINNLRQEVLNLDRGQQRLRNSLRTATGEQKKSIQAQIQANQTTKQSLTLLQRQQALRKTNIVQLQRETRQIEAAARAELRATERVNRERQQALTEVSLLTQEAARNVNALTGALIRNAASFETYGASFRTIAGSAEAGNARLQNLKDLTIDVVGLDTKPLLGYAARLDSIGLSGEETNAVIRGVVKSQGDLGKTGFVNVRILEQLTQALSANKIQYQDLLPILRETPTLFRSASAALGINITSLDDLRDSADQFGGPAETLLRVFQHIDRTAQGLNLNTFAAQMEILQDSAGLLAAELGEQLLPAVVGILKVTNSLIAAVRAFPEAQPVIAWSTALTGGLLSLAGVGAGAYIVFDRIRDSVDSLLNTRIVRRLVLFGKDILQIGRILGGLGAALGVTAVTIVQAWNRIYDAFTRELPTSGDGFLGIETFRELEATAKNFNRETSQTANALRVTEEHFENITAISEESANSLKQTLANMDALRERIRALSRDADDNAEALESLREQYRALNEEAERLIRPRPSFEGGAVREGARPSQTLARQTRELQQREQILPRLQNATRVVTETTERQTTAFLQNVVALRDVGTAADKMAASFTEAGTYGNQMEQALESIDQSAKNTAASLNNTNEQIADLTTQVTNAGRIFVGFGRDITEADITGPTIDEFGAEQDFANTRRVQQRRLDAFVERTRAEERDLQASLTRRYRLHRQFARQVVNLGADIVRGRAGSFREIVTEFIISSLRIIAQQKIEDFFRIRSDNQVRDVKIANARAVAAERARLAAQANVAESALNIPSSISSLLGLGVGVASGGQASGILAVLQTLFGSFHNPVNDRVAFNAGSAAALVSNPIAFGQQSGRDLVENYNRGFREGLEREGNGGGAPVINNYIVLDDRVIEATVEQEDALRERGVI